MSFLSVLKGGLDKAIGIEQAIAPGLALINPAAGAIATGIVSSVVTVEQLFVGLSGKGADKKAAVQSNLDLLLAVLKAGLNAGGLDLQVTPELTAAISTAIDSVVSILNAMASVQGAIQKKAA